MEGKLKYPRYTKGDNLFYRVKLNPVHIGYLSGIIEAYEGMGLVRTIDARQGVVEIWVPPDQADGMDNLLHAIEKEFPIEILNKL